MATNKALRLNQVTNMATGAVALTQFDQDIMGMIYSPISVKLPMMIREHRK